MGFARMEPDGKDVMGDHILGRRHYIYDTKVDKGVEQCLLRAHDKAGAKNKGDAIQRTRGKVELQGCLITSPFTIS